MLQLASISIQAVLKVNGASSTSCRDSQGNGFSVVGNDQSVNSLAGIIQWSLMLNMMLSMGFLSSQLIL
jgi:hypothetical protein